ncbi:hypothetical protein BDR03DRAFT_319973 [Suillus americanus]|nr:hypothetical protein BDR03DRAFT_319973 [Suillus americanus]
MNPLRPRSEGSSESSSNTQAARGKPESKSPPPERTVRTGHTTPIRSLQDLAQYATAQDFPSQDPQARYPPGQHPPLQHAPAHRSLSYAQTLRPHAQVQYAPAQRPPAQHAPAHHPPAQYAPAQRPSAQYAPAQRPSAQYAPAQQYPPALHPPAHRPQAQYPPAHYPTAHHSTAQFPQPYHPPAQLSYDLAQYLLRSIPPAAGATLETRSLITRSPLSPDSSSQLVGQAQAPRAPSATWTSNASSTTTPLHNSTALPLLLDPSKLSPGFAPKLHWQLLSYHPARPDLSLRFDIAFPTHDIEYMQGSSCGIQWTPLSDADFDKPAADKRLTKMTINFQRNLFKWDIDVERDECIRVRDVFEAIHAAFNIPLTSHERSLVTLIDHARCEEAFRLRCNLAPALPIAQQRQGWKRVDALLHETIFCGLTQSKSGTDWTLNLSGVVSKATDGRHLILDHIAADPIVRCQLDLETVTSNSPPPLPVLELPDVCFRSRSCELAAH